MADEQPPVGVGQQNAPTVSTNNDGIAAGTPTAPPPGAVSAEPMPAPPIPLETPPKTKAKLPAPPVAGKKDTEVKDTFRELIETVVFVVVLVLMLKTFLAEAFVIPTGSMATTLLGYHHKVTCEQCGYHNLVNASSEADPQDGRPQDVVSCRCENCGFWNQIRQLPLK